MCMKKKKKYYTTLVLLVFLIQGALNAMNPVIATFSTKFATVPLTTIMLISTLPSLVCLSTNLLLGFLVSKLKVRATLTLGLAIFILGGIGPYFFPDSITFILVCRIILGLGFGIVYPMGATLVSAIFQGQDRSKMMGYGVTFNNIGAITFSLAATALASSALKNVWLVHLIMAPALVLAFFMEEPEFSAGVKQVSKEKVNGVKEKLSSASWFYIVYIWFANMFWYPLFLFSSTIITKYSFGTATDAGYLVAFTSLAGAIGAAAFGGIYSAIGKKLLTLGSTMLAIGAIILFFVPNMALMYIAGVFYGIGFFWLNSTSYMLLAIVTPKSKLPTAYGYFTAMLNTGGFAAVYAIPFISGIFGKAGNLRFPFLVAAAFYLVSAFYFNFINKSKVIK